MTSRERILTSIAHKEPDRIARDLGATPSSGISAIAYNRLVKDKRIDAGPAMIYDVVQQLAQPEESVLNRYRIDVVDVGRTFNEKAGDWKPFELPDGSLARIPQWFNPIRQPDGGYAVFEKDLMIARMPSSATFFDGTYVPYPEEIPEDLSDLDTQMDMILWQKLAHSPWDHAGESDFWSQLRARALQLRQKTDRAIMIVCGCNLFEWGTFLRRIDNFLCDLLLDPKGVERLIEALMEHHLATLNKVCASVGDICDILRFGDDLGMDSGLLMQPDIYRAFFKMHHTTLNTYVHKNSKMRTFLHSCGSIRAVLPDLIEAGYDIINPVQITANGMDPRELKRDFGKDITFWGGGVDTRRVLNYGTPIQVKGQVQYLMDIFAPGGGYVFNTVHNIMPDVPSDNIEAMFEALDESGYYR